MLHPTVLDDIRPTCWLRLNRPLEIVSFSDFFNYQDISINDLHLLLVCHIISFSCFILFFSRNTSETRISAVVD